MQYTGNAFPKNQTVAMATSLPRAHHQKDSTKPYTLEQGCRKGGGGELGRF